MDNLHIISSFCDHLTESLGIGEEACLQLGYNPEDDSLGFDLQKISDYDYNWKSTYNLKSGSFTHGTEELRN